jgi:hypothetical protein
MKNAKLEILNLQGKILHFEFFNWQFSMGEPVRWDASDHPPGIYIIEITAGKLKISQMVVKIE